jgi:hypothetical protein
MSLKGIAEGIVSLSQARTAHEKRIAFLENEIRRLKSVLDGLLGASQLGSPEGEIEEDEDALSLLNGRGAIPMSVSKWNFPGQSRRPSLPPDHEHQGVYSISVGNSCQSGKDKEAFLAVNRISFIENIKNAVYLFYEPKIDPAFGDNPFVPDSNNQFGRANPGAPGDGENVYDGMDIYVGHYPVPSGSLSPNFEAGSPACTGLCGTSTAPTREMIQEPECSGWLHFAGRTLADCFGHIHMMADYIASKF